MPDRPLHTSLHLENFTAFTDARFEFVPGVNVFVGENGTGKTHAMKVLYAAERFYSSGAPKRETILGRVFGTDDGAELIRLGAGGQESRASGEFCSAPWRYTLHGRGYGGQFKPAPKKALQRPVFIPATDMMGHSKGFLAANNEVVLDFDLTYIDIVTLLGLERRNESGQNGRASKLSAVIEGSIAYNETTGRFYLVTQNGRLAMPMVAEGVRKVATLVRLLDNGWLQPGSTLLWDEPEVNLNPKLMDEVVGAILALARSGVQVFLATHSYVILKELDLQAGPSDSVRYFAFEPTENGTKINPSEDLAALRPNPILDQYDSLYDRDLTRATGRSRNGEPVR